MSRPPNRAERRKWHKCAREAVKMVYEGRAHDAMAHCKRTGTPPELVAGVIEARMQRERAHAEGADRSDVYVNEETAREFEAAGYVVKRG